VSPKPIGLRIFSPYVIPLTLVDLPGLVKNAVEGSDPNIVQQIEDCVNLYISRPNAIILAVCAANADLATADALCAAKKVDPNGDRTVGVLTKVDIVD
jgi:replication fork clamp-binding protein CrfC